MNRYGWLSIASGVFGVLLVLFLWQEPLTLSRPINDQKVTNFFLILGALAVAPTLFFLGRQLQEQQLSRVANVMPDVYPSDAQFGLAYEEREMGGQRGVQPTPSIYVARVGPIFSITNIGVGAAKTIETKWIYDKGAVDELALGHYSFFGRLDDGDRSTLNILMNGERAPIALPAYFLICCGKDLNLRSGNAGSDGVFGVKPKLRFQVNYQDIYNRGFSRVFDVDVQAYGDGVMFKFGPPA
jgi:hypothetical protein